MHDALDMGGVKAIGNLDGKRKQSLVLDRLVSDGMLQRHAIEKLHGNKGLFFVLGNFVDCADVGMVQGRGCARFTPKTLQSLRVTGKCIGQELECDEAAEIGILRLVDNAHSATTQFLDDSIMGNDLANHRYIHVRKGRSTIERICRLRAHQEPSFPGCAWDRIGRRRGESPKTRAAVSPC